MQVVIGAKGFAVGSHTSAGGASASTANWLVATDILMNEQPITLRGLMYRVVSAGSLPSTDQKNYKRLGRIMTQLREHGIVSFD
jgi:hypothetical protein